MSSNQIQVRFSIRGGSATQAAEIKGELVHDDAKPERHKIVFLNGFKNNERTWRGQLPENGEEWICEVVRDTKPDTPGSGALLVKLVRLALEAISWSCESSPEAVELFGTRLPSVSKIVRLGLRRQDSWETRNNGAGTFQIAKPEDIPADCPEDVRRQAVSLLAARKEAEARLVALIEWPVFAANDPASLDAAKEFGGVSCRLRSWMDVTPAGVTRIFTCHGGGCVLTIAPQVVLGTVRAEAGQGYRIQSLADLQSLCEFFGKPLVGGEFGFGMWETAGHRCGEAKWGDFKLPLNPLVLFKGEHEITIGSVESYGGFAVRVTQKDLGITATVRGFSVSAETHKALYWGSYDGEPLGWHSHGGGISLEDLRPVVTPSTLNWCVKKYLTPAQGQDLLSQTNRWSLSDHTHFFRLAVVDCHHVTTARQAAEELERMVAEKDFHIQVRAFEIACSEGESPDGMRGPSSWTETVHIPCLEYTGGYTRLKKEVSINLDAAIQTVVGTATDRLVWQLHHLREALTTAASYAEPAAYEAPSDTTQMVNREDVNEQIRILLESLQATVDAARQFLAQEEPYTVRKGREDAAAQATARARLDELLAELRAIQAAPFANLIEGGFSNELMLFMEEYGHEQWNAQELTQRLTYWCGWAQRLLGDLLEPVRAAREVHQSVLDGHILANFGGPFRRIGNTGQGDYWVITPTGSFRQPDRLEYRKRSMHEGHKWWTRVTSGELALEWRQDAEFRVAHQPAEPTPAQKEAVRRIESEDLQSPEGAFGLDKEATQRMETVLAAVQSILPHCPGCGDPLQVDESQYLDLVGGKDGACICDNVDRKRLGASKSSQTRKICKRDATLVGQYRTDVGILEVWLYWMYGRDNLNLVLRPFGADESVTASGTPLMMADSVSAPVPVKDEPAAARATLEQLQDLAANFGGSVKPLKKPKR